MDHYAVSSDGSRIHYVVSGTGSTALVFVHGWLGNATWWDAQRSFFESRYTVVQVELGGHGLSDRTRTAWSAQQFADDIKAVAELVEARDILLVGHSMSGPYVLVASTEVSRTRAVVLVDTVKNLEQMMPKEQTQQLLGLYRKDFKSAVESILPPHLFSPSTPAAVRARIQGEFLAASPELAVSIIEPLYELDLREAARRVTVPVRAVNGDNGPTNAENNRKYFRDYDYVTMTGVGHYPMLERPDEFNARLDETLKALGC